MWPPSFAKSCSIWILLLPVVGLPVILPSVLSCNSPPSCLKTWPIHRRFLCQVEMLELLVKWVAALPEWNYLPQLIRLTVGCASEQLVHVLILCRNCVKFCLTVVVLNNICRRHLLLTWRMLSYTQRNLSTQSSVHRWAYTEEKPSVGLSL